MNVSIEDAELKLKLDVEEGRREEETLGKQRVVLFVVQTCPTCNA
jgi:hypothetical protein